MDLNKFTEKDFIKMMKSLEFKDSIQPRDNKGRFIKGPRISKKKEWIMWVNEEGYNQFNEALKRELDKEWK